MAIKTVTPFSGELPAVPVFKNGITHYCHNQKELDKWTKAEDEGGPGYSRDYVHQEYPKLMSHEGLPDLKVANEKEQKAAEKKGYNFDHFENAQAKSAPKVDSPAAPSFDPKAQAEIEALKKQVADQSARFDALMAKLEGK